MTKLSVNLNKFALLRNSRGRDYPNVLEMAKRCLNAGADGITIHPRPDQRHAKYADVYELAELLKQYPQAELNIEGNPTPDFLTVVKEALPHQCTLVPDDPTQLTSDHGWDLEKDGNYVTAIVKDLQAHNIRVSLFMDPILAQIELAKSVGTERIELYTEAYAKGFESGAREKALAVYQKACTKARELGLEVNAGHDLDLQNLGFFLQIPDILEVSIGHALVVESFDYGLEETLKRYLKIIQEAALQTGNNDF